MISKRKSRKERMGSEAKKGMTEQEVSEAGGKEKGQNPNDRNINGQQDEKLKAAAGITGEARKASEDDYKNRFRALEEQTLRIRAEFANYKKRVERDRKEFTEHIKGEVFKQLLPVLDDFKIMLEKSSQSDNKDSVLEGAKLIHEKFIQILEKEGLEQLKALGEKFDPRIHEGLMMKPIDNQEEHNKILEVFQDGFKLKEKLLRPSKVVVGKFEGK